jgi:hypothetical protein
MACGDADGEESGDGVKGWWCRGSGEGEGVCVVEVGVGWRRVVICNFQRRKFRRQPRYLQKMKTGRLLTRVLAAQLALPLSLIMPNK